MSMPTTDFGDRKRATFAPSAKRVMSSFDLQAIARELKTIILGSKVENIYNLGPKTLLFAIHPTKYIVLEAGRRVHLTRYSLEKPRSPSLFCTILRRHLRDGRIDAAGIDSFERVIYLEISSKDQRRKLVAETFGSGNILLLDEKNTILQALTYRRMRDRNIIRGEAYRLPPARGPVLTELTFANLVPILAQKGEVVRALARLLGLGGPYIEEILLRAGIEKKRLAASLGREEVEAIFKAICSTVLELEHLQPRIVSDGEGRWIDVVPYPLRLYMHNLHFQFPTYNEAADVYFTQLSSEIVNQGEAEERKAKLDEQRRIIDQQKARLSELGVEADMFQSAGEALYVHVAEIQSLLYLITTSRINGRALTATSLQERAPTEPLVKSILSIDMTTGKVKVILEGQEIELDFRRSVFENANTYYERAKDSIQKIKGITKAIGEAKAKLEELQSLVSFEEEKASPEVTREKMWYEKFYWTKSKDCFLILGGRDAVSNELLIKKHMESSDFVFHADVAGAPFVLLKTMGGQASDEDIFEAAQMAASYSSAWKAKSASLDVYWVRAEQVSKKAPTGEYLTRGAFMIRGKKNYIQNVPLRVSIGILNEEDGLRVVGGPSGAVRSQTSLAMDIVPGRLPSGTLAKEILRRLTAQSRGLQLKIYKASLDDVQRFIPSGGGELATS